MNKKEIEEAIINKTPMVWNDPDPIEGNDYTIKAIFHMDEETALVHYGEGSEAGVFLHEIEQNYEQRTHRTKKNTRKD